MKIKDSLFRPILELRAKRHSYVVENENINSNTVLIVAILFLGDLFMIAPFILALKKSKPGVERSTSPIFLNLIISIFIFNYITVSFCS